MKKVLNLFLIFSLLLSVTGCGHADPTDDTAEFYYVRSSYVYGAEDGVIASEPREVGDRTLLRLLMMYLQGPLDDNLRSPFPEGCHILGVSQDGSTLCVTMDESFAQLENMDLTIACACIARTCFSLSDVTQVQIQSKPVGETTSVNVVLSIDSLLLNDNSGLPQHSITEESQ